MRPETLRKDFKTVVYNGTAAARTATKFQEEWIMEKLIIKCAPYAGKFVNQLIRGFFPGWPF